MQDYSGVDYIQFHVMIPATEALCVEKSSNGALMIQTLIGKGEEREKKRCRFKYP